MNVSGDLKVAQDSRFESGLFFCIFFKKLLKESLLPDFLDLIFFIGMRR